MPANPRITAADVLLAVLLTALAIVTQAGSPAPEPDWSAYVLAALTAAPVALRQTAPVLTLLVILAATTASGLLGHGLTNVGIGSLIGLFSVAILRSRPVAAAMWALSFAVILFNGFHSVPEVVWTHGLMAGVALAGVWMLGDSTKRWSQRAERAAEEAAQAVANERVRIGRELHDIVAHHMSVISLQAGLAKYVIDTDPPTAVRAIDTVGDTSREALTELRRLLDVLRVDDDASEPDDAYHPQPGLASLGELVERTRGAGLRVDLVTTGQPRDLPAGPDLCAYRIAQESLTNVLKHAGPASARIELDYGERMLTLEVTDDGAAPAKSRTSPKSHGIRGMRERAELYGGALTAGPRAGGGFGVVLRLPIDEVGKA